MTMFDVSQRLATLTRTQIERLAYIDFRAYFLGELRRADLIDRFKTGPALATRDIATYRELAPHNLEFANDLKIYVPKATFRPLFEHPPERVLTALSRGFGEGFDEESAALVRSEVPVPLSRPRMEVLAPLSRAIHRGKAVRLDYVSNTSGATERVLVPSALVDSGLRWHLRAFDRKRKAFLDFVLTRITASVLLEDEVVLPEEKAENDVQWSRIIELELVPHPAHEHPETVKLDFDMPNGVLRLTARAANAGYVLRRWNVDCSPDHHLRGEGRGKEYFLWLRDPLVLYGAESAPLAPGYRAPGSPRT